MVVDVFCDVIVWLTGGIVDDDEAFADLVDLVAVDTSVIELV